MRVIRYGAGLLDAFVGAWLTWLIVSNGLWLRIECRYFTGLLSGKPEINATGL